MANRCTGIGLISALGQGSNIANRCTGIGFQIVNICIGTEFQHCVLE